MLACCAYPLKLDSQLQGLEARWAFGPFGCRVLRQELFEETVVRSSLLTCRALLDESPAEAVRCHEGTHGARQQVDGSAQRLVNDYFGLEECRAWPRDQLVLHLSDAETQDPGILYRSGIRREETSML